MRRDSRVGVQQPSPRHQDHSAEGPKAGCGLRGGVGRRAHTEVSGEEEGGPEPQPWRPPECGFRSRQF